VVSLAVLADDKPDWRPDGFGYQRWGCKVGIRFPAVKLLDYRDRWAELERSANPFAVVIQAHLKTQETRHAAEARYGAKLALVKSLYRRGWNRSDILELFRCIDWNRGYSFLDKELQKVVRDARLGRRLADKLVRVAQSRVSSPKRQAKSPESLSHLQLETCNLQLTNALRNQCGADWNPHRQGRRAPAAAAPHPQTVRPGGRRPKPALP
jgi:hypothetical protein